MPHTVSCGCLIFGSFLCLRVYSFILIFPDPRLTLLHDSVFRYQYLRPDILLI